MPAHGLSMILLLRFPNGRLPGPRWRGAEWVVLAWTGATILVTAVVPGPLGAEILAPVTNPIGWDVIAPISDTMLSALFLVLPALVLLAAAAPVLRWRRAGTRDRAALR